MLWGAEKLVPAEYWCPYIRIIAMTIAYPGLLCPIQFQHLNEERYTSSCHNTTCWHHSPLHLIKMHDLNKKNWNYHDNGVSRFLYPIPSPHQNEDTSRPFKINHTYILPQHIQCNHCECHFQLFNIIPLTINSRSSYTCIYIYMQFSPYHFSVMITADYEMRVFFLFLHPKRKWFMSINSQSV